MSRRFVSTRQLMRVSVAILLAVLGSVLLSVAPAAAQSASVTDSCFKGDGRFDVTLSLPAGSARTTFEVELTGLPVRNRSLRGGETQVVNFTGRKDGQYVLTVSVGGAQIERYAATVSCDPEVDLTVDCLAGNGRIAVGLSNPGPDVVTYVTSVTGLSNLTRTLQPGESGKAVRTGRADGRYLVRVKRNGTVVVAQNVDVECDPTPEEPEAGPADETYVTVSCAAGLGRFDAVVYYDPDSLEPNAVFFSFTTGKIRERTAVLTKGSSYPVVVTGRNNGQHTITVRANGMVYFEETVTVDC